MHFIGDTGLSPSFKAAASRPALGLIHTHSGGDTILRRAEALVAANTEAEQAMEWCSITIYQAVPSWPFNNVP